jgi:hypothetical protein
MPGEFGVIVVCSGRCWGKPVNGTGRSARGPWAAGIQGGLVLGISIEI